LKDAFVPASNDLANTHLEIKWLSSVVAGIKLDTVLKFASVVHQHPRTGGDSGAFSLSF